MAKPKAPVWLREAFRDGVDEREHARLRVPAPDVAPVRWDGPVPWCWLAQHDPRRRPCSGPLERFHFIGRQRVRAALFALLPGARELIDWRWEPADLLPLAEWDARNGGIACEAHHRRFDNHLTPELPVRWMDLPGHVLEFADDWGLEDQLHDRCI